MLERSLLVLDEGVLEGRKVFSNIVKYVRMGASSNFGNMFSVLGASIFVPFLPMRLMLGCAPASAPFDSRDPSAPSAQKPAVIAGTRELAAARESGRNLGGARGDASDHG